MGLTTYQKSHTSQSYSLFVRDFTLYFSALSTAIGNLFVDSLLFTSNKCCGNCVCSIQQIYARFIRHTMGSKHRTLVDTVTTLLDTETRKNPHKYRTKRGVHLISLLWSHEIVKTSDRDKSAVLWLYVRGHRFHILHFYKILPSWNLLLWTYIGTWLIHGLTSTADKYVVVTCRYVLFRSCFVFSSCSPPTFFLKPRCVNRWSFWLT